METAPQKCARLVVALEALTAEESVCVSAGDLAALGAIQRQAAPLVEYLSAHAGEVTDPGVRQRIRAVINRREKSLAELSSRIEGVRSELAALQSSQRQVARVAPAYGGVATVAPSRLRAIG